MTKKIIEDSTEDSTEDRAMKLEIARQCLLRTQIQARKVKALALRLSLDDALESVSRAAIGQHALKGIPCWCGRRHAKTLDAVED